MKNLLQIPIPVLPLHEQQRIAKARDAALKQIISAEEKASAVKTEVEALIVGTKKLEEL